MNDAALCPRCGTQRQRAKNLCVSCGHDFEPPSDFDQGYSIVERATSARATWSYSDPLAAPARGRGTWLKKLLVVGVVVAVVAGGALVSMQLPTGAILDMVSGAIATPEPTVRAAPTKSATAAPTSTSSTSSTSSTATFAPIALSGKGSAVAKFTIPEGAAAIAEITHSGKSDFAVSTLADTGTTNDLLVHEIGAYRGTVLFDVSDHSVAFKIEADGSWQATIKPWTAAPSWNGTGTLAAKGDGVRQLNPRPTGSTTFKVTHSGAGSFSIWAYNAAERDLLIIESGRYNGDVVVPAGTAWLEIRAYGSWTFAKD